MRPKTFHNCFVLNTLSSKAKQLRIFSGQVLGQDFNKKNQLSCLFIFCTKKSAFCLKIRPRTFLNCFALELSVFKTKQLRIVLGRVLEQNKN